MANTIQILVVILLCCSIVAVIRLWSVLGSVRGTLENLETTRQEADRTLQRLSEVAISTDRVMREEVAPTLQQTRATLENVETTTRALAQTSQLIGRLTGHAENLTTAQKLLSLGGTMFQGLREGKTGQGSKDGSKGSNAGESGGSRQAGATGFSIAFAVVSGLRGLFARRKATPAEATQGRQIEPLRALPKPKSQERLEAKPEPKKRS